MRARDYMPSLYEGNKILPSDLVNGGFPPVGNVYFVRQTTETDFTVFFDKYNYVNNIGQNSVQPTITAALAVAEDNDTVLVTRGVYDEGAALTITQQGLKLIGSATSMLHGEGCLIEASDASHNLVELSVTPDGYALRVQDLEIAGLGFQNPKDGYSCISTGIVSTDHSYRTHIHDCWFGGVNVGEYGIDMNATGVDSGNIMVERCYFMDFATACIRMDSTYGIVRDNIFNVLTGKWGIEYVPTATQRLQEMILDNIFVTPDNSNAVGIHFVGTPTAGWLTISGNKFSGYFNDEAHCLDVKAGYIAGENWWGSTVIAYS